MKEDKETMVRRLGRTGLEVSVLGLGGHTYPVGKSSDSFQSYEDRARLVRHLVSAGVNYFDTTWVNEVELLADSFKRAGIKEDTFVSLQYVDGISDSEWRQKLRYEVEVRLNIMGYTHAPLFIMGMGGNDLSYSEVVAACEAMARLKEEGLIRNMGVSCHKIGLFPLISRAIGETDLIDYVMIRFNWKFQQANEELFPVAEDHDVGIVVMKVFCWDCGPSQWSRRISVFEPVCSEDRIGNSPSLTPAQRSLLWCIQNSPCDVAIAAMNTMWEANQNIQALQSINTRVSTDDFKGFGDRLWDEQEIRLLASCAESKTIRDRAKNLLKSNDPAHVALAKSARNAFLGHLKSVLGLKPSKR
jgi:predicted aldo/keto reductase-like oxidoreductase